MAVMKLSNSWKIKEKKLSHQEFLDLLFQMLEEDPSKEMRWLLRADLVGYSFVDRNRVAIYLTQFLSDPDSLEQEFVVNELLSLALEPEDDAFKKLCEFFGRNPHPREHKEDPRYKMGETIQRSVNHTQ